MAAAQSFVMVLMLCTHLGLSSPVGENSWTSDRECKICPPGQYRASCAECRPCVSGYTSHNNIEDSCFPCSRDCDPEAHLKVVEGCTRTSDLLCRCEDGFLCTDTDGHTGNCRGCIKILDTVTPGQVSQTRLSPRQNVSVSKDCLPPNCGSQQIAVGEDVSHSTTDNGGGLWLTVIISVVSAMVFLLVLVIFVYVWRSGDETCFKQAISKLCNKQGDRKPRQHLGSPFNVEHQPLPATNLGPVHVHNARTVIFLTKERDVRAQKQPNGDDERDCPMVQPTRSPSVHLSQEERSGVADTGFYPSQEQGKDWHMSKEEMP